jgi:hypothetical protein
MYKRDGGRYRAIRPRLEGKFEGNEARRAVGKELGQCLMYEARRLYYNKNKGSYNFSRVLVE